MFVVLPLLAIVILFATFQCYDDWRSSILFAALVWGIIITITTEVLSLFRLLEFGWLLGIWTVTNIILVAIYLWFANKSKLPSVIKTTKVRETEPINPTLLFLLSGVVLILDAVGVTALIAPPNTWDSIAYHMARVAHWLQNCSLAHYPTIFLPQLYQCPWAEMAIALPTQSSGSAWLVV